MTVPEASSLGPEGARAILEGFDAFLERFHEMTGRAQVHFEQRDWLAMQHLSAARLDLYSQAVTETLARLARLLGTGMEEPQTWTVLRGTYAERSAVRADAELAETFFNSCTRRIFHTIGVDPAVEFVAPAVPLPQYDPAGDGTTTVTRTGSLAELFAEILRHAPFSVGYRDLEGDALRIARALEARIPARMVSAAELARPVFFRGKGAYLVGRLRTDAEDLPLLLALTNPEGRIEVDAVLVTEDDVSVVFSFAHSYFFVQTERPRELVAFLRLLMPRKPVAELYTSIGFNKHGKTELYRSLLRHLETTDDRFEIAPGQRGMVMCVFTLPGFDVAFKVIRDRFDPPKTATHREVMDKYRLVFHHDRAGRLADVQEFEHLEFDRARFAPGVLEELTSLASRSVLVLGERVVIRHLYTERCLRPLDVYLREADPKAARDAVLDYGQVVRDLAATNIFPGDMLLKNFGVSRHGRLIFYDYDELCLLTDLRFRELPPPRDEFDEMANEPWYHVTERDVFPAEFRYFLGLEDDLLRSFLEAHGELLGVDFWLRMQEFHRRGEVLDLYPYCDARRLGPARG